MSLAAVAARGWVLTTAEADGAWECFVCRIGPHEGARQAGPLLKTKPSQIASERIRPPHLGCTRRETQRRHHGRLKRSIHPGTKREGTRQRIRHRMLAAWTGVRVSQQNARRTRCCSHRDHPRDGCPPRFTKSFEFIPDIEREWMGLTGALCSDGSPSSPSRHGFVPTQMLAGVLSIVLLVSLCLCCLICRCLLNGETDWQRQLRQVGIDPTQLADRFEVREPRAPWIDPKKASDTEGWDGSCTLSGEGRA